MTENPPTYRALITENLASIDLDGQTVQILLVEGEPVTGLSPFMLDALVGHGLIERVT